MEPFILAENTSAFAQQAFFFKNEDFGMSIHFTQKRLIDKEHVRYNWVRMPFKPDFIEVLKRYSRLPFTKTEEALEMHRIEEAATAEGARRILQENESLKNELKRTKKKNEAIVCELEEEKTAL